MAPQRRHHLDYFFRLGTLSCKILLRALNRRLILRDIAQSKAF
jgi:hypothetical protein